MVDVRSAVTVRDVVVGCLGGGGATNSSFVRAEPVWWRFVEFLESSSAAALDDVGSDVVSAFVEARLGSGLSASPSTRRNRLWGVRLLFRAARERGLVSIDPTFGLTVRVDRSVITRPLMDAEVEACRELAWWSSSRVGALWALAETTCRGAELPVVEAGHVDLNSGVVTLPGSSRVSARKGRLSEWGMVAVERQLRFSSAGTLVYSGSGSSNAGQVSTCRALGNVLTRSGLGGDRRVRPSSIAGWAGRKVFDESGRVEDAARVLGVRSLDSAARMIGLEWASDA